MLSPWVGTGVSYGSPKICGSGIIIGRIYHMAMAGPCALVTGSIACSTKLSM